MLYNSTSKNHNYVSKCRALGTQITKDQNSQRFLYNIIFLKEENNCSAVYIFDLKKSFFEECVGIFQPYENVHETFSNRLLIAIQYTSVKYFQMKERREGKKDLDKLFKI